MRLAVKVAPAGQTVVHDVIVTGDVNDRAIATERGRVARRRLVSRHRDPNNLRVSDRLAKK